MRNTCASTETAATIADLGGRVGPLECVNALKLNNYSTATLRVVSNILFVVPAWGDDPI